MAVAVKNPPSVGSARPFTPLPVVSLLGMVYVLASLAVVFWLLPEGWSRLWTTLGVNADTYAGAVFLGVFMVVALLAAGVFGGRLLGTSTPVGARAGILFGLVGLALVVFGTRWASLWIEDFADDNYFGASSETVGIVLTSSLGGLGVLAVLLYLFNFDLDKLFGKASQQERSPSQRVLVAALSAILAGLAGFVFVRYGPLFTANADKVFYQFASVMLMVVAALVALVVYMAPSAHRYMIEFENQGWLSAKPFKPLQGVKVRRGTLVGLLVLFGAGIYSLLSHNTLPAGPWQLTIPFTGKVVVENVGDVGPELDALFPERGTGPLVLDRRTLREINRKADPKKYVKVFPGTASTPVVTPFHDNQLVSKEEYNAEIERLKRDPTSGLSGNKTAGEILPTNRDLQPPEELKPATGKPEYAAVTLLPNLRYTLGLLILPLLAIWVAWRVINLPAFADFQIATEAEMNKVSWTTKKRLYQDTIVVLVTVFMLAVYLFALDTIWSEVLSLRQVGVIVLKRDDSASNKHADEKPY